jgi:hypothetical protein
LAEREKAAFLFSVAAVQDRGLQVLDCFSFYNEGCCGGVLADPDVADWEGLTNAVWNQGNEMAFSIVDN